MPKPRPEDGREDSGRQSSPAPSVGRATGTPGPGRAATPSSSMRKTPADATTPISRLPSAGRKTDSAATARSPEPQSAAGSAAGEKAGGSSRVVEVDGRCTGRSGGDARVQLLQPLKQPPPGNSVQEAHKLSSLEGETIQTSLADQASHMCRAMSYECHFRQSPLVPCATCRGPWL